VSGAGFALPPELSRPAAGALGDIVEQCGIAGAGVGGGARFVLGGFQVEDFLGEPAGGDLTVALLEFDTDYS
jgi:hypothetical protein